MIPEVKKCSVKQCFYNRENECFANSILVGSKDPICETYATSDRHTNKTGQAEVGACHVEQCSYNQGMFCHACGDIEVKFDNSQAWCNTYEPRA